MTPVDKMVEELMAIEDKKFIEHTDWAIKFYRLQQERRVWRDPDGLVHELYPEVVDGGTENPYIACWYYTCRGNVLSSHMREREPDAVVTCLSCLGA